MLTVDTAGQGNCPAQAMFSVKYRVNTDRAAATAPDYGRRVTGPQFL
ncbi:hypothetical protein ABT299_25410 [Spirillospora sp. NPDC000708]